MQAAGASVLPLPQVALLAENSHRWLVADQGIMMCGAADVVGVHNRGALPLSPPRAVPARAHMPAKTASCQCTCAVPMRVCHAGTRPHACQDSIVPFELPSTHPG